MGIGANFGSHCAAARRFQHQRGYTFAGDETAAFRQGLRVVADRRQQICGLVPFVDGARERITREDDGQVCLPMAKQGSGLDQRALARKALAADGDIRPSQVVKQSHMTGRSVGERLREGAGIGPGPTMCDGTLEEGFGEFNTAEGGGEDDGNPRTVHLAKVDPSILNSQSRSYQGPRRQAIQTPGLQSRHYAGRAKRTYQKRSPQSGGWPGADGARFHRRLRDESGEWTIGTHGTDTGNSNGDTNARRIRRHARTLPNMRTVLLPPNPADADSASGRGWRRTAPRSQFTPGLSMASVRRRVGNSASQRMAVIVIAASNAPAAPRQCPK